MFFTSDTHFGHARIIELCDRPFESVEHMNETLVDNWNSVVGRDDVVVHLGDVVMGTFVDNIGILGRLNGEIHLIPGNHDRVSSAYSHRKPDAFAKFESMYAEQGVTIHAEVASLFDGGILDGVVSSLPTLCHYPFNDERFPELCPPNLGQWLIHGHVHDAWKVNGRQINVGVDVWDFTPVSLDQLQSMW